MNVVMLNTVSERVVRRNNVINEIKDNFPGKKGSVLIFSGFERDIETFYQDSFFEYFFGVAEPAVVSVQRLEDETLRWFIPHYGIDRSVWCAPTYDAELLSSLGVVAVERLGKAISGYCADPYFDKESVNVLCEYLEKECSEGRFIFTPLRSISIEIRVLIDQLCHYVPQLKEHLIDISPLCSQARRTKSENELELLYNAIDITAIAHQAVAGVIRQDVSEADVQAALEYVFIESGARKAFPSIVATGKNATILHYSDNNAQLSPSGLTVVDIGAAFHHYCADITRTYPTKGVFSKRQSQVYQDVLDTQTFIFQQAKPGMFLRNKQEPEKCLNSLAKDFLKKRGYDVEKVFPHGIGHFVGLDVHDVGDVTKALMPGDVITIEPGIYLSQEELGVRIEDMYWIVDDGAICLSEDIPKERKEVESLMRESSLYGSSSGGFSAPDEH